MPTNRYRDRDGRALHGGYVTYPPGAPSWSFASLGDQEYCWDTIGNYPEPNGFSKVTDTHQVAVLTGQLYTGDPPNLVEDLWAYPVTPATRAVPEPRLVYPSPTAVELQNDAWEVLARTNVSRPHVSVPTFVGELKDVPSLVKDWGGSLLKKVAKGHLTWRWAIRPIISDVSKMLDFVDAVDQRTRQLEKLRDGRHLQVRCGLGKDSQIGSWSAPYLIHTATCLVYAKERLNYSLSKWGSVQYSLNALQTLPRTAEGLRKEVNRIIWGLTSAEAVATAWELIPWSWFYDWFFGVGTVLQANNNTILTDWARICVMRTLVATREYQFTQSPSWVTLYGEHYERRHRKERYKASPVLPIQLEFPFLDGGKWSILGSLLALKKGR